MARNTHRLGVMLSAPSLLALAMFAGCGGSSEGSGPEDKFIGRWRLHPDTTDTAFTISCPTLRPYIQWIELVFEHGSVTDLIETAGFVQPPEVGCTPALSFNISGNTATIVNPDPYIGAAPFCDALGFNEMGQAYAIYEFEPNADWSFELQAEIADKPPEGLLKGSATVTPYVPNATTMMLDPQPACDYTSGASGDRFIRLTQP
jgi:hypothetical protein